VSPSGGAVSATLGTQTVTVKVPAGAVSGPGTLAVTVYSGGTAPKTLLAAGRKPQTVDASAVLISEFSVTLTGATLVKPLQASLTTAPATSGSIFRLAGFGTKFDDVDTVTYANGVATSDLNILWPRMSLASNTLYAFYTEPAAKAGSAAPVIAPASAATLPIPIFGATTFTAAEADANGFPYLDPTFSYAITNGNGTIGSVNSSTGAFTAGSIDASGTLTVTDTTTGRGNPKGTLTVGVSSQRPGNTSDSFVFSGTLSATTQLNVVSTGATPKPQVDTSAVTLSSNVDSYTPGAGGGSSQVTSKEIDTYPLLTLSTKTISKYKYAVAGSTVSISALSSDVTDSNGVRYLTQYGAGNGLLDVLPETAGSFGPNNASLSYYEVDQAGFKRQRDVRTDGSYIEKGYDVFGDVQTINANADLSAFYDANQYSGYNFTITKPNGSNQITVSIKQGATNRGSLTIASWIPVGTTQASTETDVTTSGVTFPVTCSVPAKYGTSGNQLVQTIKRVDPALGNFETMTTTTYVGAGVGPVCIVLSDVTKTYYDYTLQNGFVLFVSSGGPAVPLQTTTISETLTLQSSNVQNGTVAQSGQRSTSSIAPTALVPVAFARARFEHVVRQKLGGMREATFNKNFMSNGVQAL
jgi:hypothetical protein